jgi:hypothetical protein
LLVAIHQPNLLPRLKVLQKLALADVWIVLDDVQFARRDYQNRALLVPNHGTSAPHWCTLPVQLPHGRKTLINEAELYNGDNAVQSVERSLTFDFRARAEFDESRRSIIAALDTSGRSICDIGVVTTLEMLRIAGAGPRQVVLASRLAVRADERSLRLSRLCREVGGRVYIADSGGTKYIDEAPFNTMGISVIWHVWRAPTGAAAANLGSYLRDGSAINLLARAREEFTTAVSTCAASRRREFSAEM